VAKQGDFTGHTADFIDPEKIKNVILHSELIHKGVRFDVYRQSVKGSSGYASVREFVAHPGAAVILPIMDNGDLVLIRTKRFAVDQMLWELPAGTLEQDEKPIDTAKRELEEETGYRANSIEPLLQFHSSPGICNEVLYAFVAHRLEYHGQQLDDNEEIEVEVHSWSTVEELITNGSICDAKTLSVLLYYKQFVLSDNQ
jgi:ADP-ribose pyrophosphatase